MKLRSATSTMNWGTLVEMPEDVSKHSGWKPTHLASVFALWTSVLPPDGTILTALIRMLKMDVSGC